MTFEVIKASDGKYRWRMRDESGRLVKVQSGRIGLPPLPAAQKRRIEAAWQATLKAEFEAQTART